MLKIRLQRVGRKHEPSFRLVLTDSKNSTKSGRFKEILGSYDPRKTNEVIKGDRVKHWVSMGAGLTDSVHNLLINQGIIDGKKKNVLPKKTAPVKEVVAEEAPVEASASTEESLPAEPAADAAPEEAAPAPVEETTAEETPAPEEPAPAPEEAPVEEQAS